MRYYIIIFTVKSPEKNPVKVCGMRTNDMASIQSATRIAKHFAGDQLEDVIAFHEISGQQYEKIKF